MALLLKCFIIPFHNKAASRYKVCIQNVVIVFFLGFASQVVPYVNSSIVFFLFINKVSFEMKWRCHHGSCLLFVGITFILPNNFYFWVGFVRNPTIEKGIKRCVTLGSFEHSFGDIQALVWVLSTSLLRQCSILNSFHTWHMSLVFQSNTAENLMCVI